MTLQSHVDLTPFNTLALPGRARVGCRIRQHPEAGAVVGQPGPERRRTDAARLPGRRRRRGPGRDDGSGLSGNPGNATEYAHYPRSQDSGVLQRY